MFELITLILSCILSSIITIFVMLFVNHIRQINYKKQIGILFNLVKKNRASHGRQLKNIFTKYSEYNNQIENLDKKIIKLLNLEHAFFIELTKALQNQKDYNLNILFKTHKEFYTYLEILFSESLSLSVNKNNKIQDRQEDISKPYEVDFIDKINISKTSFNFKVKKSEKLQSRNNIPSSIKEKDVISDTFDNIFGVDEKLLMEKNISSDTEEV